MQNVLEQKGQVDGSPNTVSQSVRKEAWSILSCGLEHDFNSEKEQEEEEEGKVGQRWVGLALEGRWL